MTLWMLLAACGAPECDPGYGFADGECVPIDTDAKGDQPFNWGGGTSAELFYERLVERYCQELKRCGTPDAYTVNALCHSELSFDTGYDYTAYGQELRGCTVDPALVNACLSATWSCIDYGDGFVMPQIPEVCNLALDVSCDAGNTTYTYEYGTYDTD